MRLAMSSFLRGVKNVWANKFLVALMFVFKVVSSLVLLFPLYLMFSASFARNVKASNFLTWFDLSLFIDFVSYWKRTLSVYFPVLVLGVGMVMLAFIFLSGGFWGILRDGVRKGGANSKMERFLGYCGKYFWGMFKMWLLTGLFYFAAFLIFLFFCAVFDSLAGKANLWDITSWRMVAKLSVGVVLFLLVNMIGDYLRIFLIENYDERFLQVVSKTLKFVLTNLLRALSLYYSLSVIFAIAIFSYLGLTEVMDTMPQSAFFIFVTFLIQQSFVLLTCLFRMVYYSSQLALYDKIYKRGLFVSQQV